MGGIEACASRWRWVERGGRGEGGGGEVDIRFFVRLLIGPGED